MVSLPLFLMTGRAGSATGAQDEMLGHSFAMAAEPSWFVTTFCGGRSVQFLHHGRQRHTIHLLVAHLRLSGQGPSIRGSGSTSRCYPKVSVPPARAWRRLPTSRGPVALLLGTARAPLS